MHRNKGNAIDAVNWLSSGANWLDRSYWQLGSISPTTTNVAEGLAEIPSSFTGAVQGRPAWLKARWHLARLHSQLCPSFRPEFAQDGRQRIRTTPSPTSSSSPSATTANARYGFGLTC